MFKICVKPEFTCWKSTNREVNDAEKMDNILKLIIVPCKRMLTILLFYNSDIVTVL